ncbi:EAL domain-containing protein [Veronia nyctiphanis]|nr:EAL domain-containing protein [Veronia nyctiphanis]
MVDTTRSFVMQSLELSPEITILIIIAFAYPLILFFAVMAYHLTDNRRFSLEYYKGQVNLCSSLCVSFGLIGTFVGLALMIEGIASGMGVEGDFSTKMASLLGAISSAMDAMSLAFLTSILGVSASVAILFSTNFFSSYFLTHGPSNEKEGYRATAAGGSGSSTTNIVVNKDSEESIIVIKDALRESLEMISSKEKVWSDLFLLMQKSSGSTVVDQLNKILYRNNQLVELMSEQIKQMRQEQSTGLEGIQVSMKKNADQLSDDFTQVSTALDTVSSSVEKMNEVVAESQNMTSAVIEKTSNQMTEVINRNLRELSKVAEILGDIRLAVAVPIEDALKDALRQNVFTLMFQPVFHGNGEVKGAETFLRWEDPVRGSVLTRDLLDAAREADLLNDVDRWVMVNAIRQLSKWYFDGKWQDSWQLSINCSSERLLFPLFMAELTSELEKAKIPPKLLAFEITEQTIMDNPEAVNDKMMQLHRLGVSVYLDNFGTGFTSLGNLRNMDIDRVKVSRTITDGMTQDLSGVTSIIRSIMVIANEMDLSVSAEGIETKEQMELLKREGCSMFQGYYFGRPKSPEEFILEYIRN